MRTRCWRAAARTGARPAANWWEINTSAIADWPEQSRLIELMDNGDGTLSIFGTLTNTAAPVAVPASGTPASGFGNDELASISRAVTMNDPQLGDGTAEGAREGPERGAARGRPADVDAARNPRQRRDPRDARART